MTMKKHPMNVQSSGYFIRPKGLLATLLTGWVIILLRCSYRFRPKKWYSIAMFSHCSPSIVLPATDLTKPNGSRFEVGHARGLFGDTGEVGWCRLEILPRVC